MVYWEVGERIEINKTFTAEDLKQYGDLVHYPSTPAKVVPTALLGGLFSYLLGTKLPGVGTIYLKQQTSFLVDALIATEITASVEIIDVRADKGIITLKTVCKNNAGQLLCEGEAVVMAKKQKPIEENLPS